MSADTSRPVQIQAQARPLCMPQLSKGQIDPIEEERTMDLDHTATVVNAVDKLNAGGRTRLRDCPVGGLS